METWLNIQYSIKRQYRFAVQYQYPYGLIFIPNMNNALSLRGSGLRNLSLCQQIVGREKFNGIVMITTIWGKVDLDQARDRERKHYDTP